VGRTGSGVRVNASFQIFGFKILPHSTRITSGGFLRGKLLESGPAETVRRGIRVDEGRDGRRSVTECVTPVWVALSQPRPAGRPVQSRRPDSTAGRARPPVVVVVVVVVEFAFDARAAVVSPAVSRIDLPRRQRWIALHRTDRMCEVMVVEALPGMRCYGNFFKVGSTEGVVVHKTVLAKEVLYTLLDIFIDDGARVKQLSLEGVLSPLILL